MNASSIASGRNQTVRNRLLILSPLIGAAAAFVLFVLFLQTATVSLTRLALAAIIFVAISLTHYWLSVRWLLPQLTARGTQTTKAIALAVALTAIFLPLLYNPPGYPLSPLLRPWADLAVQFKVPSAAQALVLPQKDLRLIIGKDVIDSGAFNLVGHWDRTSSGLQLAPGSTGSLQWTGPVSDTITLFLQPPPVDTTLTVYWNNIRTSIPLRRDNQQPLLMVEKTPIPWGYVLASFLSCAILAAWILGLFMVFLRGRLESLQQLSTKRAFTGAVVILAIFLAVLTVKLQIDSLAGGLQYVTTTQLIRHTEVLQGQAPNPWQYRVLSEWLAELLLRASRLLAVPSPADIAFISLRLAQNAAIFTLAFALYRQLLHSNLLALVGVLVLAASMKNAYYDNDLAFNTYFDLLFYLACGILLLSKGYYAVVILMPFAALNRETSGLIPFLMAAAIVQEGPRPQLGKFVPAILAALLFASVFFGLRLLFPGRPIYIPYKHPPGAYLLLYNVTRQFTWEQLWRTLGLVPLLGLIFISSWPRLWRSFLLILCPIWFGVHVFASVMAETRLFLVPQALVFIPGVLFMLDSITESRDGLGTTFTTSYSEHHEPRRP